eukprot:9724310-Heterocapsa_arctica.AAC.1
MPLVLEEDLVFLGGVPERHDQTIGQPTLPRRLHLRVDELPDPFERLCGAPGDVLTHSLEEAVRLKQ